MYEIEKLHEIIIVCWSHVAPSHGHMYKKNANVRITERTYNFSVYIYGKI